MLWQNTNDAVAKKCFSGDYQKLLVDQVMRQPAAEQEHFYKRQWNKVKVWVSEDEPQRFSYFNIFRIVSTLPCNVWLKVT